MQQFQAHTDNDKSPYSETPRLAGVRELLTDPGVRAAFNSYLTQILDKSGSIPAITGASPLDGSIARAAFLLGGEIAQPVMPFVRSSAEKGEKWAADLIRQWIGSRAIYPGSFDPFTLGHKDIVIRASSLIGELIIAVGKNAGKNPTFSVDERLALIREEVKDLPGNITVTSFSGLLANFARDQGIRVIIRGVRGITDFDQELQLARANRGQAHGKLETFFFPASGSHDHVSSSAAREIAAHGGLLEEYLSPLVRDAVTARLGQDPERRDLPVNSIIQTYKTRTREQEILRRLRSSWDRCIASLEGIRSLPHAGTDAVFNAVISAYSQPFRICHNLEYLSGVTGALESDHTQMKRPAAVMLAAFFSRFVYDPAASDNEVQSSLAARRLLKGCGLSTGLTSRVAGLIMAVKTGNPAAEDTDARKLLDACFSVLAAPPEEYQAYAENLRREHSAVSQEAYRRNREELLEGILKRDRIFHQADPASGLETAARMNVAAELRQLRGSVPLPSFEDPAGTV